MLICLSLATNIFYLLCNIAKLNACVVIRVQAVMVWLHTSKPVLTFKHYIMNTQDVERFLSRQKLIPGQRVKIAFKKRDAISGLFVEGKDYNDLKAKNFWRIVTSPNIEAWSRSKDIGLAKIFSGFEFSSLSVNDKS